jgi:uroporphyrinogen III methyltransferase/synthase
MEIRGKVYIIGAGPGDDKLLTVKAAECIARADVIIYDRLLGEGIIGLARPEAELIYAGKEPDHHFATQEQINELLVRKAMAGKMVARVKGGDPFLFGRGGEEAEVLAENGICFEVVPGVTSAVAVPAYAGIPVTHRGFSSALHIITGHEKAGSPNEGNGGYQKLGGMDGTLVFLMGVKNMAGITESLMAGGQSSDTPVAVIENGTTSRQRVITGTLGNIARIAAGANITSPAVMVIGAVVSLREKLSWFPRGPLAGKRIVITRAREQSGLLKQKIAELGGEPLEIPVIVILPPVGEDLDTFDRILAGLNEFTWLTFTSANGVKAFWRRIQALKMDVRSLAGLNIAAIGAATAQELWKYGLKADFMPESYTTAALQNGLIKWAGPDDKILLLRADIAPDDLEQGLAVAGIACTSITAYRTVLDSSSEARLKEFLDNDPPDYITFTSSSTVHNFINVLKKEDWPRISGSKIVCIGPVTADTAYKAGLHVDAVADPHTIDGLVAKILELEGSEANAE